MRRRIYTDTSVFGGCFDDEFREPSRKLFDRFQAGNDLLILSDLTRLELQAARYGPVNLRKEYPLLEILTPREVLSYE